MKRFLLLILALAALMIIGCSDDDDKDNSITNIMNQMDEVDFLIYVGNHDYRSDEVTISISEEIANPYTFTGTYEHTLAVNGVEVTNISGWSGLNYAAYTYEAGFTPGEEYEISYTYELSENGSVTYTKTIAETITGLYFASWDAPYTVTGVDEPVVFSWTLDGNNQHQIASAYSELWNYDTYDLVNEDEYYKELGVDDRTFTFPANCVSDFGAERENYLSLSYGVTSLNYVLSGSALIYTATSWYASNMYGCGEVTREEKISHMKKLANMILDLQ